MFRSACLQERLRRKNKLAGADSAVKRGRTVASHRAGLPQPEAVKVHKSLQLRRRTNLSKQNKAQFISAQHTVKPLDRSSRGSKIGITQIVCMRPLSETCA